MKKTLLLFFTLTISLSVFSQEKIAKGMLIEDLDILKTNLEKYHPGLYEYTSKPILDLWFDSKKAGLRDSLTSFEFYNEIVSINSMIKNGHSNLHYPSLGDSYKILPIKLYKRKNTFYIQDVYTKDNKDLIGKEILSIDEFPMLDLYNALIPNFTRDGLNLSLPNENFLKYFSINFSLKYGAKKSYEISYKDNNEVYKRQVSSVLLNNALSSKIRARERLPLTFEIKNNIAYLRFPTFNTSSLKKQKYKQVLANAFSQIEEQKIKYLIVDVRNNGGGDPIPTQELISYLYDKEFRLYDEVYAFERKIKPRKLYKKQGILWLNLFSWALVKKKKDRYYEITSEKGLDIFSPKGNNFKGNLYVLANGNSFSATGEFTSFIKQYRKSIFIGEEVGGNKIQNTSGISFKLQLPNSKLRMEIPIVLWKMNVSFPNNGHGVIPDYWVRNTIEDELNNQDSILEYTIDLIEKSK